MQLQLRILVSLVTLATPLIATVSLAVPAAAGCQPVLPRWVDEPITFAAGGVKVYGTFRHPVGQVRELPAVLLIAGSGPTDRNGTSPLMAGHADTLLTLAHWLSNDGVASLR